MLKNIISLIDYINNKRIRRRLQRYHKSNLSASLDHLIIEIDSVPGMISLEAGPMLYILSAIQDISGDIIEIGSWQGRSTIFLAKGAKTNNNGKVFAIDHFQGNPGKKNLYQVNEEDLSDLKDNFKRNISDHNVDDHVELIHMKSEAAASKLDEINVTARLLFIDGNHEYEAVKADFNLFRKFLLPGAIVVFDDYSEPFPGVIKYVTELIDQKSIKPLFTYGNCFVSRLP